MTTDWRSELRRTWALQQKPSDDRVVQAHVLTPGALRPLRVHTSADGSRHLLVPGNLEEAETVRGDALRCEVRELEFDGQVDRFLDIACSKPPLFEVFDDLLASILEDAVQSGDPMASAVAMLGRWRELLRAWSASLSHEREMSLFAELYVLELVTRRSAAVAASMWRGPLREPKDILFGWWVEVKGVAPKGSSVWINGLDQLADIAGAAGYLAVVTVVEDEMGRTIDELADVLRGRFAQKADFDELLLQAGWVGRDDAHRWSAIAIDVVGSAQCPRLVVDPTVGVPAGIGRVRYELDLMVIRALAVRDGSGELLRLGEQS